VTEGGASICTTRSRWPTSMPSSSVLVATGVAGLTVVAAAQTPPTAPAIARTVVAGTKLPSLGDTPLYFRVVSVSIPPGQNIRLPASNGILYQLSGSTEVSAGEAKTITGGGGVLIASGTIASLTYHLNYRDLWPRRIGEPDRGAFE
jgi:hypothetical protein